MLTKKCVRCGETKLLDEFHRQKHGNLGRHSWCKDCYNLYKRQRGRAAASPDMRRKWNLSSRYGITEEGLDAMIAKQGGVCAICGKPMKRPCVDHNHITGEVRGILCHRCNIVIGGWDDADIRNRALRYLGVTTRC